MVLFCFVHGVGVVRCFVLDVLRCSWFGFQCPPRAVRFLWSFEVAGATLFATGVLWKRGGGGRRVAFRLVRWWRLGAAAAGAFWGQGVRLAGVVGAVARVVRPSLGWWCLPGLGDRLCLPLCGGMFFFPGRLLARSCCPENGSLSAVFII